MSEAQAVALTLVRKPVTVEDFKQNAEFYYAAAVKATEVYNEANAAFIRAQELSAVSVGVEVIFNEGKGEAKEVLTGKVLARLEDGKLQVLVQFVGAPAKLLNVKPSDLIRIKTDDAVQVDDEPVEMPAQTPEFDAAQ